MLGSKLNVIKGPINLVKRTNNLNLRFQSTTTTTPVKKSGSGFLKLVGFTTLASMGYSGIVYYAAHDEKFQKEFIKYAPLGQSILDYVLALESELKNEKGNGDVGKIFKEYLDKSISGLKDNVNDITNKFKQNYNKVNEPTLIEKKSNDDIKFPIKPIEKETKPLIVIEKAIQPEVQKLYKLASDLNELKSNDVIIIDMVSNLERFIQSININVGGVDEKSLDDYAKLLLSLQPLNQHLNQLIKESELNELDLKDKSNLLIQDAIKAERNNLESNHQSQLNELIDNFNKDKLNLVEELRHQLDDKLKQQSLSLDRFWRRESKLLVDRERNFKLSKLNQCLHHLKLLEQSILSQSTISTNNEDHFKLQNAIDSLDLSLQSNQPFVNQFRYLVSLNQVDPLVKVVIDNLNPQASRDGIPTFTDLKSRFQSVSDEVRKAALAGDGSGFMGHLVSSTLSNVLFKKHGLVSGEDVESILARADYFINNQQLDLAAREINQLNGWPKKLVQDWLNQVVIRLEYNQAIEVLKAQLRVNNLERLV